MRIAIPDDYQDVVHTLKCFRHFDGHQVIRYREPANDVADMAARLADADAIVPIRERSRFTIFDIDPVFANTEEWWLSIPEERRPSKDQPFYHLLAENAETEYIAYVSEQNLLPDDTGQPLRHPQVSELFTVTEDGSYKPVFLQHPH